MGPAARSSSAQRVSFDHKKTPPPPFFCSRAAPGFSFLTWAETLFPWLSLSSPVRVLGIRSSRCFFVLYFPEVYFPLLIFPADTPYFETFPPEDIPGKLSAVGLFILPPLLP